MDNFSAHYDKLNEDQKKAVDTTDGPLLILAGPGTGKTELLSVRAANIIRQKKANPENILILTYTNPAAKAMKERLVKMIGRAAYDVEASTFHSFANSVILGSEYAVNYIQEKILMTELERVKLLEYILDNTDGIDAIRPPKAPYHYRKDIETRLGDLKREGVTTGEFDTLVSSLEPDGILMEEKHVARLKALAIAYKLYEEYKNGKNEDVFDSRGRYDFDDMIMFAAEALSREKRLKDALREQYKYVMADEFQDTNGAQLKLLFELAGPDSPNLCCVGDDDQAIYRFQGASIANFAVFKERFSSAQEVLLKDNYRSTKEIASLSGNIIKHIPTSARMSAKEIVARKNYKDKVIEFHEFSTESAELLYIADRIREIKNKIESSAESSPEERRAAYNNIAVLVRRRSDVLRVVDAFLKAGIPYATDGKEDISGENRVRQMLDVLNLAHTGNPSDYASRDSLFYRVITSDYFGTKFNDILKFIAYVNEKKRLEKNALRKSQITLCSEFIELFCEKGAGGSASPAKTLNFSNPEALKKAAAAIKQLLDGAETRPIHAVLMEYVKSAGIYRHILESYDDNEVLRIRELRSLCSFLNMVKIKNVSEPAVRLADFIGEIDTMKKHNLPLAGQLVTMTQDGVRVFTAHGSKGLEFHTVIIPFCLQKKSWPYEPQANKIPLPPGICGIGRGIKDKETARRMNFYDETRLFYVASTRAKSSLIYTSSPEEDDVSSVYLAAAGLAGDEPELRLGEEAILAKSLHISSEKDPFIGTEAVLKDLVSNLTLNPTKLNNYIRCRRKFLYDNVLLLPGRKNPFLTFGNCVHKALEDAYGQFMRAGRFPDFAFFTNSFNSQLLNEGVDNSVSLKCKRWFPPLAKWFEKTAASPVMPIALEEAIEVMLSENLVFRGKIDKTEFEDEKKGLVRVIDYKTGSPDEHVKKIEGTQDFASSDCDDYLRQLAAYKLLFERSKKSAGRKVSHGVLVFTSPAGSTAPKYGLRKGEYINKKVELTDAMVSRLEEVIKACWRDIMGLKFEKLDDTEENRKNACARCDYYDICWGRSPKF